MTAVATGRHINALFLSPAEPCCPTGNVQPCHASLLCHASALEKDMLADWMAPKVLKGNTVDCCSFNPNASCSRHGLRRPFVIGGCDDKNEASCRVQTVPGSTCSGFVTRGGARSSGGCAASSKSALSIAFPANDSRVPAILTKHALCSRDDCLRKRRLSSRLLGDKKGFGLGMHGASFLR